MTILTAIVRILIGAILLLIGLIILPTPVPIAWIFFTLGLIVLSSIFPPADWIMRKLFKRFPRLELKIKNSKLSVFIKEK